ncbi:hypothetical protein FNH06_10105 [Amycolatopsis acidiphila]|uniref:Transglycosylase SLT domain-containing protein n=2 Tax=Amycolatopsis acidiphila TaxID=715473 RepID=A0A558AGE2_9PSEU|nr:hypothetical protein FNH06_10105 [Amycolatopsis acidiphila]
MSVAGAATPVALAGTAPAPPPAGPGTQSTPALLGLPDSWGGATGAPAVVLPLAQPGGEPPKVAAPPAGSAEPQAAPAGDRLDQWITEAVDIMRQQGVPVSTADIPGIRTIIEKESDGDPDAVNHWDANARAGHPSKGLMQCVDQTFQANKLAGHDDIFDPVDNIIAGVRYTISRYGGFDAHPGLASLSRGEGYRGY